MNYWAYQARPALSKDIGHTCRECRAPFTSLGQTIVMRRGGRIELNWSEDPRSQKQSSFNEGKWKGSQMMHAPGQAYKKMRTGAHF